MDRILLLILTLIQTLLYAGGQVMLKLAMNDLPKFSWTRRYLKELFSDWWLLGCGACFSIATILWLYILKNAPLSQAYPLSSMSYIFAIIAAIFIFSEQVPAIRWVGVVLIVIGCALILK